jgi:hypothetical protein
MKLRIIASFIAALIYVTTIAQNPVLNYKNFIGTMYNSFDLTSSKVNISDTFQILETGQNITWDFTEFGEVTNNNFPKITYSFLPKEESWLLDSATDRWFWTDPEFNLIIREDYNDSVINVNGNKVLNFFEVYFSISDSNIIPVGEADSYNSRLYSKTGGGISYFIGINLILGKEITQIPLMFNKTIVDTSNLDTLGSTPTFWSIRKRHTKKNIDATGKIIFPFGEVENSMRLIDIAYVETEKVNKNTGLSTIDSIIGFDAYWYAPDLQHCVPITKMSFYAEKPTGGKWNVSKLDAYITDQQSLTILENWSTPIENWFYPNPATNEITLVGFENATSFKIYGLNGQIIKQGLLNQNVINTESISPNFYILEVFDGKTAFKSKLVIQ